MNNSTDANIIVTNEQTFRSALYIIFLVWGTTGGFIVISALYAKRSRKSDNDIFLINLTCSDVLTIWFYVGVQFYIMSSRTKGIFFCRYIWPFMSVPLSVSIFTTSSMAVVRSRSVVYAWKQSLSRKSAVCWVLVLWITAIVVIIPAATVSKSALVYCKLHWSNPRHRKVYTGFLFAVQYAIPLIIVTCAYVAIGINLRKYERNVVRRNVRKENFEIIKALAIVVILFGILMLPLQVGWMLWEFGSPTWRRALLHAMNYADVICILHSCLNPCIYGILPKQFRLQYRKWSAELFRSRSLRQSMRRENTAGHDCAQILQDKGRGENGLYQGLNGPQETMATALNIDTNVCETAT
ncbi:galanin receptor type 1 [Nematostella vectensis]|uniref:galanin receptor type 1 n=1 Tax=Nematostella vectensis TaxID=45351 RepID=UPI002076FEC3|nr:galanin receptor type 1 [Nematostella vectensis]XP_032234785.2 galanin receptor type 1 [Nematostella vectensis]XP_032234786.2 galanin receptor type 1 [Nematostella vectensis]XP_032234787.2 galanin receptor type 1 [Nematostella vectensis]